MQEIISWYMEHKTYGNILIIGIIGLMLYNIGYGAGTDIYRIFGLLVIGWKNKRNIEIEHELYNNFWDFV